MQIFVMDVDTLPRPETLEPLKMPITLRSSSKLYLPVKNMRPSCDLLFANTQKIHRGFSSHLAGATSRSNHEDADFYVELFIDSIQRKSQRLRGCFLKLGILT